MSVSLQNLITLLDSYTSENTEERISNANRYQYLSEAASDIKQQMQSAMSNMTYPLKYVPGIHSYKINQGLFNVMAAGDIRVNDSNNSLINLPFHISSPDKINEDISLKKFSTQYALDRYDGNLYLTLSYMPTNAKTTLGGMDSITGVTGIGDTASVEVDSNVSTQGNSVKVVVDVSSSGSNFAGVKKTIDLNLSKHKGVGNVVGYVYITDVTNVSNVEVRLGTDSSNYYSFIATSPHNESAFKNGWNRVVIDWTNATVQSSPDATNINVLETIVNYTGSQSDTVLYFDDFFISNPIDLTFHFLNFSLGKNLSGTELLDYTEATDIPYYSGQYDNLKFAHARLAASFAFHDLRLYEDSQRQEIKATQKLAEVRKVIPSNHRVQGKAFRPLGVNFNRKRRR